MPTLIAIALIIVFIVDLSGIIGTLKRAIWRWLKGNAPYQDFALKPLDCSLCMTFWIGTAYVICSYHWCIWNLVAVCALAYLTPIIKDAMLLVKEALQKSIDYLFNRL